MRDLLEANYQGRSTLVTGDTGFECAWQCFWLTELGAEVEALALALNAPQKLLVQLGLADRTGCQDVDIRYGDDVTAVFRSAPPEYVFHLAAQSLVRSSYDDPKATFDSKIGGSVNVLEAVRAVPSVESVVYVTSDKCYRKREWLWEYHENHPLGGRDRYSAPKAGAEIVCEAYRHSFFAAHDGIGLGSLRAGKVIGGGDRAVDRLLPDCVRSLIDGAPISSRISTATRPWQHDLEPLSGYLWLGIELIGDPQQFSGAWNIGSEPRSILSVGQLPRAVVEGWGSGRIETGLDPSTPHEALPLSLTIEKARHDLGWTPRWDVGRAGAEIVACYPSVHDGGDAKAFTRTRIEAYIAAAA